jgi:ethanolamine utilization microcompartment shell protein EutL
VAYVAAAVERRPEEEIAINPPGTLPQRKLGRNIDTFVAAQFLAEALPTLRGPLQARAERALGSVVKRIERAQGQDGSYSRDGWAPLLASAFANNGLYAAQRAGAHVDKDVLAKGQAGLVNKYDDKTKSFAVSDSAGVQLYSVAASVMAAAQVAQSSEPVTPELKKHAEDAHRAGSAALSNENVLRGFGSYGGEEHVSYMLTAEAKAVLGGAEWAEFRRSIRARLAAIQRENGTWRGDHCITSTTFCTAASLITLAVESRAA